MKWFLPLFAVAIIAGGCNPYKKMAKGVDQIGFTTTPEVLSLCSKKVAFDLSVNFPAYYFAKRAVVQVTPVLTFADGEIVFEPFTVQGSAVANNSKSVNFMTGGVVTENLVVDYKPSMRRSTLSVRVAVCDGEKFVPVNPKTGKVIPAGTLEIVIDEPNSTEAKAALSECEIPVAEGVNTIVNMIDFVRSMSLVDDKMVEMVANQSIFEKGYTASLISEEDHVSARELNNEGVKLAKDGKLAEAKAKFMEAKALGVYVDVSNRNLMMAYLAAGMPIKAMGVYDIVDPVQRGAVAILNKEFCNAIDLIEDNQTLAVLNFICNDANAALTALGNDDCPRASYIRAVILAKQGKKAEARKALDAAIKVESLKAMSKTDVNLASVIE